MNILIMAIGKAGKTTLSKMIKVECPKYGIKYIDTSKNREKVLSEILENLFNKIYF